MSNERISADEFSSRLARLSLGSGATQIPRSSRDRAILYAGILLTLDPAREHDERRLTRSIQEWLDAAGWRAPADPASLRRMMVDEGILKRDRWGRAYQIRSDWITETFEPEILEVDPLALLAAERRRQRLQRGDPDLEALPPLREHLGPRGELVRRGYENSARLHDLFDRRDNIEFFARALKEQSEALPILDIGAGTGRIALPLAERGGRLECFEPSPAMHGVLAETLALRPELSALISLHPPIPLSEARGLDPRPDSAAAAILSGVFDHFLTPRERSLSLQKIHRALRPGGKLFFDAWVGALPDQPLEPAGTAAVQDAEIRRFLGRKAVGQGIHEVTIVFETAAAGDATGGHGTESFAGAGPAAGHGTESSAGAGPAAGAAERIEERSLVGAVTAAEIRELLNETGFEIIAEYADYGSRPFQDGEDLLVVEARKKEKRS